MTSDRLHPGAPTKIPMLSAEQIQAYKRDGIIFPIDVFASAEAEQYRLACEALESSMGGRPRTVEVRQMHLHFAWAHALATHPALLDIVEPLLGPTLLVWATELFSKPKDPNLYIGWHRDRTYCGFRPGTATTAWIALAPSTRNNGCMQVVIETDRVGSNLGRGQKNSVTPALGSHGVTNVELLAGQVSLHDSDIYHGSGSNTSELKRVGLAIRYVSPEAIPAGGPSPVLLARGSDVGPNFTDARPPSTTERSTAAILDDMHESAMAHLDTMLRSIKKVSH